MQHADPARLSTHTTHSSCSLGEGARENQAHLQKSMVSGWISHWSWGHSQHCSSSCHWYAAMRDCGGKRDTNLADPSTAPAGRLRLALVPKYFADRDAEEYDEGMLDALTPSFMPPTSEVSRDAALMARACLPKTELTGTLALSTRSTNVLWRPESKSVSTLCCHSDSSTTWSTVMRRMPLLAPVGMD